MLRSIIQRIFVAVREADNAMKESWGLDARDMPGYREALIDVAVCLNAAHAAFDLRHEVEARCQVGDRSPVRRLQPAQSPGQHAGRSRGSGRPGIRQPRLCTHQSQGLPYAGGAHGRHVEGQAFRSLRTMARVRQDAGSRRPTAPHRARRRSHATVILGVEMQRFDRL